MLLGFLILVMIVGVYVGENNTVFYSVLFAIYVPLSIVGESSSSWMGGGWVIGSAWVGGR